MRKSSLSDRFWSKVDKTGDCWVWTGVRRRNGYGQFSIGRKLVPAHRVAYEMEVGPILEGLVLDHLCRNKPCVNPAHLEPVTGRENTLRGISFSAENARKTHCERGHEFTPENTYQPKYRNGRECRACKVMLRKRAAVKERQRKALKEAVEVQAFPVSRKGHIYGEGCWCRPYRDSEVPSVLVHRKVNVA